MAHSILTRLFVSSREKVVNGEFESMLANVAGSFNILSHILWTDRLTKSMKKPRPIENRYQGFLNRNNLCAILGVIS
jgi:hypothetical protein